MALGNTFAEKTQKFLPILDEIYQKESCTSILEMTGVEFDGTKKVRIPRITMDGLGTYNRSEGYVGGGINVDYEEHELTQDRGRKFRIDIMDNDEAAFDLLRNAMVQFVRTKEIPEMDAYRLAKIAGLAGNKNSEAITNNALAAFDKARKTLLDQEVDLNGLVLFCSSDFEQSIRQDPSIQRRLDVNNNNGNVNRTVGMLDGSVPIVVVPAGRFKTEIQMLDGSTTGQETGGFKPGADAKGINFILGQRSVMKAIAKRNVNKIIEPKDNQFADAYDVMYRLYHDLIVETNKRAGIYVSSAL